MITEALNPVCILYFYVLFISSSLSTGVSCLHKWGSVPNKMKMVLGSVCKNILVVRLNLNIWLPTISIFVYTAQRRERYDDVSRIWFLSSRDLLLSPFIQARLLPRGWCTQRRKWLSTNGKQGNRDLEDEHLSTYETDEGQLPTHYCQGAHAYWHTAFGWMTSVIKLQH